MSKYYKAEDVASAIADREQFEAEVGRPYKVFLDSAKDLLKDLPTVEVSEDAISRKWVLNEIITKVEDDDSLTDEQKGSLSAAKYLIRHAPPVVPKRPQGEWFIREYEYFTCDQCGEDVESYAESTQEARNMLENGEYPNFCPNCGADMKGGKK